MPAKHHRLLTKVYDAESGDGGLELAEREDGKFELTVYHNNEDLTVYSITPSELEAIAKKFMALAASAMNRYLMNA